MSDPPSIDSSTERRPVCPHCMTENRPGMYVCGKCGATMDLAVPADLLDQMNVAGTANSGAVRRSAGSTVLLAAMWLIFGPQLPVLGHLTFIGLTKPRSDIPYAVTLALIVLYGFVLYQTTYTYWRKRREPLGQAECLSDAEDEEIGGQSMWQCLSCGESVEMNMDICWKCGSNREGIIADGFAVEVDEVVQVKPAPEPKRVGPVRLWVQLCIIVLVVLFLFIADAMSFKMHRFVSIAFHVVMACGVVVVVGLVAAFIVTLANQLKGTEDDRPDD